MISAEELESSQLPDVGQVVRIRMRIHLVEQVERDDGHGTLVSLACLDDDAQGQQTQVIWELELDRQILDKEAWQSIGNKGFDAPRYFSAYIHSLRWNCVTATDPKLFQSPFRAGIRIDAYQLEPLRKALQLPRVNLFIADDVGLGKTIEAGLIASELLLRRRVKEVVVACPPSMIQQWKDEMESRFGLTFEIFDCSYLERIRQERGYGVNAWMTFPRFIISQRLLIDEAYTGPLRDWLDTLRPGSMFILDEAHHAAPSSGAKYAIDSRITKAVRELAHRFEHRLFLSATPHNGHSNSFSALLELLDDQRFTRGVEVAKKNLEDVMVRRLKEDVRQILGGLPKREVKQIDLSGLPSDTPELKLSKLLDEYRQVRQVRMSGATRRKQATAALLISNLQQRLLSSVEAFARTLAVHRRTMERIWANETTNPDEATPKSALFDESDSEDERSQLAEDEQQSIIEFEIENATKVSAGDTSAADIAREKDLLDQMQEVAEAGRGLADERVLHLLKWTRENMCPGIRIPGEGRSNGDGTWTNLRVLIFTEYEDTRRYLVALLRQAIVDTDLAEHRIAVYHGPTPPDKREAIKRAFNLPPSEHPLRILVATDAAREGINLQAHCHHLFHFDVPWNPSRLEQRNGRIDRKLQLSPFVYCHYFVYTQRPEDRVLRALVRKTETIRKELGSLAQVLEGRLAETLRTGIQHDQVIRLEKEIDAAALDSEKRAITEHELESARQRQEQLAGDVDVLRKRLNEAREWIGLDMDQLRDALSCSLELLGADPLKPADCNSAKSFVFPNLDSSWTFTLDTLRVPPEDGKRSFEWRRKSQLRPVVFSAPEQIDDDVVQLHLQHRIVQRLLDRFMAQGFINHDLSRACLAQTQDAIPRVVLLGRLSLYGAGATRLHEELLTVTAKWIDPVNRKGPLTPYGRDTEAKTLELLERALSPAALGNVSEVVAARLQASIPRDIEELLPHLNKHGNEAQKDAEKTLKERGRIESEALRKVLADQKKRVEKKLGQSESLQLTLGFNDDEKRQLDLDRRGWQRWLQKVEGDLQTEPERIRSFYQVKSFRLEPIGLAYLWPVSN